MTLVFKHFFPKLLNFPSEMEITLFFPNNFPNNAIFASEMGMTLVFKPVFANPCNFSSEMNIILFFFSNNFQQFPSETAMKETVQIPLGAEAAIIGRGGETMRDLRAQSGCKIKVGVT